MGILEKNKRLSDSLLWELQTLAYTQFGPEAWGSKGVPFYLTSNPLIAKQFAHVILGYVRDCLKPDAVTPLNLSEPLYLFDLGAGTGRLGYLILRHLLKLLDQVFSKKISICYIMTDIVPSNIENWQKHPFLQPFIEKGELDFAYYQHADDKPIELLRSGKILDTAANPIVLIGTYYFDTIPQDLFRVQGGRIEEGKVTLSIPNEDVSDKNLDPSWIMKLQADYAYFPIEDLDGYYPDQPFLTSLFLNYAKTFDTASFLFPIGGLISLQHFSKMSDGRMLLLAGDQGVCTEEQILEWSEPIISQHASFSMAVNYHAMAHYFQSLGGAAFLTTFPEPKFVLISAVLGGNHHDFSETCLAFNENIDAFEPVDYWQLTSLGPEDLEKLPLVHLLLFLKLGNWDPINCHLFFSAIRKKLPLASKSLQEQFVRAIYYVWDHFYFVHPSEGGFVMNLGVLLYEIGRYSDALLFFQRAMKIVGEDESIRINIAQCYRALEED